MGLNIFHRGYTEVHEENSVKAIVEGIARGGVEIDAHPTADDFIVIHHDATWDRLTQYTGRVSDTLFSDANSYRTDRGYDVPSFWQAVNNAKGQPVFLDMKEGSSGWSDEALTRAGITLTSLNGFGHVFPFSSDYLLLDRFKTLVPEVNIVLRPVAGDPYSVALVQSHDAYGVLVEIDSLSENLIDEFHANGLKVFGQTYSLSSKVEYDWAMHAGIDGIVIDWSDYQAYNNIV